LRKRASRTSALKAITWGAKPGVLRPVVIPKYQSIPVFIIKNNLRAAGISRERYFELLDQC
jgi:hypothetical protein